MQNLTQIQQQVLALGAIFQTALLVDELAQTGNIPSEPAQTLLKSVFVQNPESFSDIYPNVRDLNIGLHGLRNALQQSHKSTSPNIGRYVFSLLHLQKKLDNNPFMLEQLGKGIERASRQINHFDLEHENIQASLADTYKQTLSNMSYRIKVTGNPNHLKSEHTANKVRALLLAGIRATKLWRQVGGKRWHFVFKRKLMIQTIDAFIG